MNTVASNSHAPTMLSPLPKYLLLTAFGGATVGATHGAIIGFHELLRDTRHISTPHLTQYVVPRAIEHGKNGLFLGPWAPVLAPIYCFIWRDARCPHTEVFRRYK